MGLFPGETGEARDVPNVRKTTGFVFSNIGWVVCGVTGVTSGMVGVAQCFGCRLAVCLVATGLPNALMAMRILCIGWRWW